MTDPIHFAVKIETYPTGTTYVAACGYVGLNPNQFTDIHGKVRVSLGGMVTCEACREKMGVVRCDGGGLA